MSGGLRARFRALTRKEATVGGNHWVVADVQALCDLTEEAIAVRSSVELAAVRKAFADAFMHHPTGRMTDMDVLAVLDSLT